MNIEATIKVKIKLAVLSFFSLNSSMQKKLEMPSGR